MDIDDYDNYDEYENARRWLEVTEGPWFSNAIQFPRLIEEIAATQAINFDALAESMDLEKEDVYALFERARVEWEHIKEGL